MDKIRHRTLLKAQSFVDQHRLDPIAHHWAFMDLRDEGVPWTSQITSRLKEEWALISGVSIINVPKDQVRTIKKDMESLGFIKFFYQPIGSIFAAIKIHYRRSLKHESLPIMEIGMSEQYTVLICSWTTKNDKELNLLKEYISPCQEPLLILGRFGVNRYKESKKIQKIFPNKVIHAYTYADTDSRRWVRSIPDFDFGTCTELFVDPKRNPDWSLLCYVTDNVNYADCRPIRAYTKNGEGIDSTYSSFCWLRVRLVLQQQPREEKGGLPLSVYPNNMISQDIRAIPDADMKLISHMMASIDNDSLIRIMRFIASRNKDSSSQPKEKTVVDRTTPDIWKIMNSTELIIIQGDSTVPRERTVHLTPVAHLYLATARAFNRFARGSSER